MDCDVGVVVNLGCVGQHEGISKGNIAEDRVVDVARNRTHRQNHELVHIEFVCLADSQNLSDLDFEVVPDIEDVGVCLLHKDVVVEAVVHDFRVAVSLLVFGD